MVEAVGGADLAVLGAAHVHLAAHLGRQHLAQLHAPLIKRVDAPDEALQGTRGSATLSRCSAFASLCSRPYLAYLRAPQVKGLYAPDEAEHHGQGGSVYAGSASVAVCKQQTHGS